MTQYCDVTDALGALAKTIEVLKSADIPPQVTATAMAVAIGSILAGSSEEVANVLRPQVAELIARAEGALLAQRGRAN